MTVATGASVLLVEDEALVRRVIGNELRDAGMRVREARCGDEALAALADPFDFLLTDIRLPGQLSGWDIAEVARQRLPGIRVVYMTGFTAESPRHVPGSRLIAKPCTVREILDVFCEARS